MKIAISMTLLLLAFLSLMFLGIDIDERYKEDEHIPHTLLAYYFGASVVCGIVIGLSSTFLLMKL